MSEEEVVQEELDGGEGEEGEEVMSKEEIVADRLANSGLKRKAVRSKVKRRSTPIRTAPPDNHREAYNIEVPRRSMNEPWRPASMLTCRKKPGFRSRWVRKELLEKRIEEGWSPRQSNSRSRVEAPEQTLVDGRPLSAYVIKRNLVLCDMPEELAASRDKYYKKITESGLNSQKSEFTNQTSIDGQQYGYGDIKVEK